MKNTANSFHAIGYSKRDPKAKNIALNFAVGKHGQKGILTRQRAQLKCLSEFKNVNRVQYPPIVGGMGPVMEGHGEG